jgi:hypothetical protein
MTDGLEEFNNLVAAGECIAIGAKCLDAGHAREEILDDPARHSRASRIRKRGGSTPPLSLFG